MKGPTRVSNVDAAGLDAGVSCCVAVTVAPAKGWQCLLYTDNKLPKLDQYLLWGKFGEDPSRLSRV
jgi:hypothetical protein